MIIYTLKIIFDAFSSNQYYIKLLYIILNLLSLSLSLAVHQLGG